MNISSEIRQAIKSEIYAQKQNIKATKIKVEAIQFISSVDNGYIYLLEIDRRVNLCSEQPVDFSQGKGIKVHGKIIDIKDYSIFVFLESKIDETKPLFSNISFDPTFILEKLEELLITKNWIDSEYARYLIDKKFPSTTNRNLNLSFKHYNSQQNEAIKRGLLERIHIIWGPPGTGKTRTMGKIVTQKLRNNKKCLLLSISNVAVDQLFKSVVEQVESGNRKNLLRLGIPSDRNLDIYTIRAKVFDDKPLLKQEFYKLNKKREELNKAIMEYRQRLQYATSNKQHDTINEIIANLYKELKKSEATISSVEESIQAESVNITNSSSCIAITLAGLVVNKNLHSLTFDAIYVDEVSMVPLVFILAAAKMTSTQLIIAGDPQQLPPIYMSEDSCTKKWIGQNIYEHLNILTPDTHNNVTFLNEQYRMQKIICNLVSSLCYDNKLITKTEPDPEAKIMVVSLPVDQSHIQNGSYYSVSEKSYYFPLSIFIISALIEIEPALQKMEMLFLSPFRAQEKLLNRLASDLSFKHTSSSTIHRAQGSESDVVILDFTIHNPNTTQPFFQNTSTTKKLLNVALSRAKTKLIIICNFNMLSNLAKNDFYYEKLYNELSKYQQFKLEDIFKRMKTCKDWLNYVSKRQGKCFYASLPSDNSGYIQNVINTFKALDSDSPVIIGRENQRPQNISGIIWRTDKTEIIPPFSICGSELFLYYKNSWLNGKLINSANTLKNLSAGHLLEKEVDIHHDGKQLICFDCGYGMELIRGGYNYKMSCSNPDCRRERNINLHDAKLLAELYQVKCPLCNTKMIPRQSKGDYFFGCANYPSCKGTQTLNIYTVNH